MPAISLPDELPIIVYLWKPPDILATVWWVFYAYTSDFIYRCSNY